MKKLLKALTVLTLILSLALMSACAAGGGEAQPPAADEADVIKVGVTLPNLNIPHWVNMKWAFEQEAEKLGCELTFVHAEGYENIEKQINQIQDFIASDMDAIIVAACDADAVVNKINEAIDKGITVVEVNNLSNGDRAYAKIKSDDYEMGQLQAELMNEALGGTGKVVMINAPGGTTLAIRGQGFRETVEKDYKGIEILAEQFVASDPEKCTAAMEDFLQTYPDIDGVFCWSETAGVCAASVVATQNKDIIVTAMDATNATLREGIKDGSIYGTVAQEPITLATLALDYAVKGVKGEPNPEQKIFAPITVITTANIDTVDMSGTLRPDELG